MDKNIVEVAANILKTRIEIFNQHLDGLTQMAAQLEHLGILLIKDFSDIAEIVTTEWLSYILKEENADKLIALVLLPGEVIRIAHRLSSDDSLDFQFKRVLPYCYRILAMKSSYPTFRDRIVHILLYWVKEEVLDCGYCERLQCCLDEGIAIHEKTLNDFKEAFCKQTAHTKEANAGNNNTSYSEDKTLVEQAVLSDDSVTSDEEESDEEESSDEMDHSQSDSEDESDEEETIQQVEICYVEQTNEIGDAAELGLNSAECYEFLTRSNNHMLNVISTLNKDLDISTSSGSSV